MAAMQLFQTVAPRTSTASRCNASLAAPVKISTAGPALKSKAVVRGSVEATGFGRVWGRNASRWVSRAFSSDAR
eukprot:1173833-Prorocentrum_minimum.AAC.2